MGTEYAGLKVVQHIVVPSFNRLCERFLQVGCRCMRLDACVGFAGGDEDGRLDERKGEAFELHGERAEHVAYAAGHHGAPLHEEGAVGAEACQALLHVGFREI